MAIKVNDWATHTPEKPSGSPHPKLGIFSVSSISSATQDVPRDREVDRQYSFSFKVPQSSAFPFTLQVQPTLSYRSFSACYIKAHNKVCGQLFL